MLTLKVLLLFIGIVCSQKFYYVMSGNLYSADFDLPNEPKQIPTGETGSYVSGMVTGYDCEDDIFILQSAPGSPSSFIITQYTKRDHSLRNFKYDIDRKRVASGCGYTAGAYSNGVLWLAYTFTFTQNKTREVWASIASFDPTTSQLMERAAVLLEIEDITSEVAPPSNATTCTDFVGDISLDLFVNPFAPQGQLLYATFDESFLTFHIIGDDLQFIESVQVISLPEDGVIDAANQRLIGFLNNQVVAFDLSTKTTKILRDSPVNLGSVIEASTFDLLTNGIIISDLQDGIMWIPIDGGSAQKISLGNNVAFGLAAVSTFFCDQSSGHVAIIVGCAFGGIGVLAIVIGVFLWRRAMRQRHKHLYHIIQNNESLQTRYDNLRPL